MVGIAEIVTPATREVWADVVRADPFAVLTQSPEWTDAMCAAGGHRDVSRLYETAEGRILVSPLLRRSWARTAEFDASNPRHCGVGGVIAAGGVTAGEISAVLDDLSRRRTVAQSVRPGPLPASAWRAAAAPPGAVTVTHRAHLLDLAGGWEKAWGERFSEAARRQVRQAREAGVTVECGTGGALLPEFCELMELAARRWARRLHEPPSLTTRRLGHRDPRMKFEAIGRFLGVRFRVYLARLDGRPVAVAALVQGGNAYYFRGALGDKRHAFANYLVQARAVAEACAAGCRYYYLGDSGWSRRLARFKESLGGLPCDYPEYRFERLPVSKVEHGVKTAVKRVIGFRDGGHR